MCYDQYAIKIVLTLILVSLYTITLATRIKKGTLFIFTSQSCTMNKQNKKTSVLRGDHLEHKYGYR